MNLTLPAGGKSFASSMPPARDKAIRALCGDLKISTQARTVIGWRLKARRRDRTFEATPS